MKRILFIIIALVSFTAKAQVLGADMINLDPRTTTQRDAITIAQGLINGSIILNTTTGGLERYNGSAWVSLGGTTELSEDLSPVLSGVLDASNFGITNLADPTSAQDAATKTYVDDNLTGGGIVVEGTSLFSAAGTNVITHGLGYTPSIERIKITILNTGSATLPHAYISDINGTTFSITVTNTGSNPHTIGWAIFGTGLLVGQVNTDNQTASEVAYTNNSQTTTEGALDDLYASKENSLGNPSGSLAPLVDSYWYTKRADGSTRWVFATQVPYLNRANVWGDSQYFSSINHFQVGGNPVGARINFEFPGGDKTLLVEENQLTYDGNQLIGGGAAEYRNPEMHFVPRNVGSIVTNEWAVTTGQEGKETWNEKTDAGDAIYTLDATFTSARKAKIKPKHIDARMIFVPDSGFSIKANGTEYVDTSTTGHTGVLIDSINSAFFYREGTTFWFDGFVKPYSGNTNPELYLTANRIANIDNEADATTGIYTERLTEVTTGLPATPDGSTYIYAFDHTTGSAAWVEPNVPGLTIGETYEISYYAWKSEVGGNFYNHSLWSGIASAPVQEYTTTPTLYTVTREATATTISPRWRFDGTGVAYLVGLSAKLSQ